MGNVKCSRDSFTIVKLASAFHVMRMITEQGSHFFSLFTNNASIHFMAAEDKELLKLFIITVHHDADLRVCRLVALKLLLSSL